MRAYSALDAPGQRSRKLWQLIGFSDEDATEDVWRSVEVRIPETAFPIMQARPTCLGFGFRNDQDDVSTSMSIDDVGSEICGPGWAPPPTSSPPTETPVSPSPPTTAVITPTPEATAQPWVAMYLPSLFRRATTN